MTTTQKTVMNRMSLDNLVTGRQQRPVRIALYGVDGIGKSTFASEAPGVIFLAPEDGTAHLDIPRFQQPQTWADIMDAIAVLYEQDHDYHTLAVDSVDWAEQLSRAAVCDEHQVSGIEGLGYGKGHVYAQEKFSQMLRGFDALYAKGMNIIAIAHSEIKPYNDPELEPYDRYTIKMEKRTAPLLREWADYVLFANYDTSIKKVGEGMKQASRAVSYGKRMIHTQRTAAYDAKRRYSIPDRLPLEWPAFWNAHQEAAGITNPETQAA